MDFAQPIEQYLFGDLLTETHVFVYLKDIRRGIWYEKNIVCDTFHENWRSRKKLSQSFKFD